MGKCPITVGYGNISTVYCTLYLPGTVLAPCRSALSARACMMSTTIPVPGSSVSAAWSSPNAVEPNACRPTTCEEVAKLRKAEPERNALRIPVTLVSNLADTLKIANLARAQIFHEGAQRAIRTDGQPAEKNKFLWANFLSHFSHLSELSVDSLLFCLMKSRLFSGGANCASAPPPPPGMPTSSERAKPNRLLASKRRGQNQLGESMWFSGDFMRNSGGCRFETHQRLVHFLDPFV